MAAQTEKGTRFIRTSRYELWRHLRLLAWAVPVVNAVRAWPVVRERFMEAVSEAGSTMPAFLAASSIFLLTVLLASFTWFFLWWVICTIFMWRARREATFSPTLDLEYYREKLDGLSAVQVSMLADLRVEEREDAAATLLGLAVEGIVSIVGGYVYLVDEEALRRKPRSTRLLAQFAAAGQLNAATTKEWAAIAQDEAVDGIYLQRIGENAGGTPSAIGGLAKGCATGCLVIFIASMLFAALSAFGAMKLLDQLDTLEDDYQMVPIMMENPLLLAELVIMVIIAAAVIVGFVLPLVDAVRGYAENGDASRIFRRTPLGEQATECVYGIRNYVRDFTALSEADKNALMLWDEFAVYAVALGENRSAVDEILALKGFSREALGL